MKASSINQLVANGYDIFNVITERKSYISKKTNKEKWMVEKQPSKWGTYGFTGWETADHETMVNVLKRDHDGFGLRCGKQHNGRRILSLDFDCCGNKDENDVRVPCEKTKQFLKEYKRLSGYDDGVGDGMFHSSTSGNMNVLIDYTDCEELVAKIDQYTAGGKDNFQINVECLQILLAGNQVIPPTLTTNKITGNKDKRRAFLDADKPFRVLTTDDNVYVWLSNMMKAKLEQPITKVAVVSPNTSDDEKPITPKKGKRDKWTIALLDVIKQPVKENGTYLIEGNEWKLIAGVLKSNGYGKDVWKEWNELLPNNWCDRAEQVFDTIGRKPRSIYCFVNLMKKYNPEGYELWKDEYDEKYYISTDDLEDNYKISQIIAPRLKSTLILCFKQWYMLNDKTQLWSNEKYPSFYITKEVRKYIDYSNAILVNKIKKETDEKKKDELIEKSKEYLKAYKTINASGFNNKLAEYLMPQLTDNTLLEKLNVNSGCLSFQNGILDLETQEFRYGLLWDDYLTEDGIIKYDYDEAYYTTPAHKEKYEWFKNKVKEIANNTDDHLNYYQVLLGFSFIGKPELEKMMMFMIDKSGGEGDNGKSLMFELLTDIMPCYVYKTDATMIEDGNTKTHKQIIKTDKKRIVWLDEMRKKKVLNHKLLKILGEGSSTETEIVYGTSYHLVIYYKLFMLSNHLPNIGQGEDAVFNRAKQFSFRSHFDRSGKRTEPIPEELKFIADPKLGEKLRTEYVNELFRFIIDGAYTYYKQGIKVPSDFTKDIEETHDKNDGIGEWVNTHTIADATERLSKKCVMEQTGGKYDLADINKTFARKGYKYEKGLTFGMVDTATGKNITGGWKGLRMKTDEEYEDD